MSRDTFDFAVGRLPFASEVFGTYRPMVGWASKRKRDRILDSWSESVSPLLQNILPLYVTGNIYSGPPEDRTVEEFGLGRLASSQRPRIAPSDAGTFILPELQRMIIERIADGPFPGTAEDWRALVNSESVTEAYGSYDGRAIEAWKDWSLTLWDLYPQLDNETPGAHSRRVNDLMYGVLDRESRLGAALIDLASAGATDILSALLLAPATDPSTVEQQLKAIQQRLSDPFVEFDPRNGLHGVTVSPLGIVHYFRQYFFELDTFLGPAVGHVWLTPGTEVELIESSTRRTYTEQTSEYVEETRTQRETTDHRQEDISDAIKQENRSDSKLGFSTTVNQSWPTGDASATASINVDTTQGESRESTYKRMREQSDKVSTEMRSSYKTTFKSVTETTDVSSKRYLLKNPSETELQNYEMRRKMRRVAVQVQDVGTYLCWETFVDDPGRELGLANLVHIAKQTDLTPPPYPTDLPMPETKPGIPFDVKTAWAGEDRRIYKDRLEGILLGARKISVDVPPGYRFDMEPGFVFQLQCVSARGEGDFGSYQYLAKYLGGNDIEVILAWTAGGLDWDNHVDLDLRGTVTLAPTQTLKDQIVAANTAARDKVDQLAAVAQGKADEKAFYDAAQERIELAAGIEARRFEDLREEERTVVYRALVADLMAGTGADKNYWYKNANSKQRHVYATVLNAIFDVERMLYFVAPEWWKPRAHSGLILGQGKYSLGPDKVVGWEDTVVRDDNYFITGKSKPARLGSSLGWLLQLDGDDMRNRFLNAPWVRAVMPVRPGKEEAAIEWLTKAEVEGAEGLDSTYAAQPGEDVEITQGLADVGLAASDPPTVRDAIRYLCWRVSDKHKEGTSERLFPDRDGLDDGDKVWSTPIDKVYEHGFYPLGRSFRASPVQAPADGTSPNFQIMSQWTEVLPTDQIVPVPVMYDPITGRQIPPADEHP